MKQSPTLSPNHLKDIKVILRLILLVLILSIILYTYVLTNKQINKSILRTTINRTAKTDHHELYDIDEDNSEELVIAYCSEDLSWVEDYVNKYDLITIYNKCGNPIEFSDNLNYRNIRIIQTPNVGSCDYAFLSYIIERYNSLPDFIEFTKGTLEPLRRYHTCSTCTKNGDNSAESSAWERIKNFSISNWSFSYNNKNTYQNLQWKPSGYKNMGEWIKETPHLSEKLWKDQNCNIIYGGQFGASKEQILLTPKIVWETLRSQQTHAREEVDHFIERTWRPLLCRKLNKSYIKNQTYLD